MDCAAMYSREWHHKNRERVLATQKRYREKNPEMKKKQLAQWRATPSGKVSVRKEYLKRVFGLSLADYITMAVKQGGVCLICAQVETRKDRSGKVKPLSVDHDHLTGKVRGLLCDACNNAIGNLRDDPQIARAVARYLEGDAKVVPLKTIGGT